jgi:hypothetical protein
VPLQFVDPAGNVDPAAELSGQDHQSVFQASDLLLEKPLKVRTLRTPTAPKLAGEAGFSPSGQI